MQWRVVARLRLGQHESNADYRRIYTIKISETNDGVQAYGLSLERLSPTPPDAVALTLAKNVTGDVSAPTSQNTFTFNGGTTGTYEIAASLAPNPTSEVCFNAYQPNGTSALSGGSCQCTCNDCCCGGSSSFQVQANATPSLSGHLCCVDLTDRVATIRLLAITWKTRV